MNPPGDQGEPGPPAPRVPPGSTHDVPAAPSAASVPPGPADPAFNRGAGRSVHSVRSELKVTPAPSVRPGRSVRPGYSVRPGRSVRPGKSKSTVRWHTPARRPEVPRSIQAKRAIQKRAQGRTKVPSKFRDSLKRFFFLPTGMLKILRLCLVIGAVVCFFIAKADESFIAITVQEACIVLFFILIYMVTLQHLLVCLHWPLLDLINSFISAVFLLIVSALTIQEKKRRHLFYVGGLLCLLAAILCVIDALVVTKKMRNVLKRAVGIQRKQSSAAVRGSRLR